MVVSHASTSRTIDFAPTSLLSTAVLAWYTDVKHEVKSVTSGYRLVLAYNLIHVAPPGVPHPILPQRGNSVDNLTLILRKWRDDKYTDAPKMPLLAYVLQHGYSTLNLKNGFNALKGADAHLATFLRDIAEKLGYMVGLATLQKQVSGPGDDYGKGYYQRKRLNFLDSDSDSYSDSDSEEDTPGMLEISETTTSITGLVDFEGISLLPGKIELEKDNLVSGDPFEDKTPNKVEYEGYMGNVGIVSFSIHTTHFFFNLGRRRRNAL